MKARGWLRSKWVLASIGLLLAACIHPFFYPFGRPTTPMTIGEVDKKYAGVSKEGMSREVIQAWLTSHAKNFDTLERKEDPTYKGWWMGCLGNQTMAECAGLNVDNVYSVVRVHYPDATRHLIGQTMIIVFFFNENGNLLKGGNMNMTCVFSFGSKCYVQRGS